MSLMCSGCPSGQLSEIIILLLCSYLLPWDCFSCVWLCVWSGGEERWLVMVDHINSYKQRQLVGLLTDFREFIKGIGNGLWGSFDLKEVLLQFLLFKLFQLCKQIILKEEGEQVVGTIDRFPLAWYTLHLLTSSISWLNPMGVERALLISSAISFCSEMSSIMSWTSSTSLEERTYMCVSNLPCMISTW